MGDDTGPGQAEGTGSQLGLSLKVADPPVLVLAAGDTPAAIANAKGHLFERFVARLLHLYGYTEPTTEHLNVVSDGIELDVVATHELSRQSAIAECKAYTSHIAASMLGTFHSKLITRRYNEPGTQGFFVAIPRLTSNGQEVADLIAKNDDKFTVLTAGSIVELLRSRRLVVDCPKPGLLASDPAVLVTEHGVYGACLEVDGVSRRPKRVLVWGVDISVPDPVLEAVGAHDYAQGCQVVDAREPTTVVPDRRPTEPPPVIVTVSGSRSDFEYQLPASPRYFVGRNHLIKSMEDAIDRQVGVLVLNAQSGWGKSSAALRLQASINERGGHALVVDSRTATYKRFVTDAVCLAAQQAQDDHVLKLPDTASWASLPSALRTLRAATWHAGPIMVFFDQFENVFRHEELTREFRDLALGVRDLADRVIVGFAWKTDLVGWTENYPYQLRDQIRDNATVITIGPLGASEIDTLLRRLEKELGSTLARDLRTRLREYSQGLPWLFKKLAGHLIHEVRLGATQEQLANEALNVQNLFDADLAELGPPEHEAIRHIARYAPISIGEVMERVTGPIVESLLNRRLVVQVGERLDTYWDIFRDYINNGRIPVEDSYILRQGPVSVSRLLRAVVANGGDGRVPEIAASLGTSENSVFNLSRELRLLGATAYEPNRVRLLPEIWNSPNREAEFRRRVVESLKRHRAFTTFVSLAERAGSVTINGYARELPSAFPAVAVSESTWVAYARVYLQWFEYAGLAIQKGSMWLVAPDGSPGMGELLGGRLRRRTRGGFPHDAPGPSLELLAKIASGTSVTRRSDRRAAAPLLLIGAISETTDGRYYLQNDALVSNGAVVPSELKRLMLTVPGVREGIALIEDDPQIRPEEVGQVVRSAVGADWATDTTIGIGKHLRSWARAAGVYVQQVKRLPKAVG